jgi:M6 family metalloprotease-like protein
MPRPVRAVSIPSILAVLLTLTAATTALSYPMYGEVREVKQPDGTVLSVKIFGDEYYRVVESMDGYVIVPDEHTGEICYARLSPDANEFESTGVRVGSVNPQVLGIEQHLRIDRTAQYEKIREMREAAGVEMPGEVRRYIAGPPSTGTVLGLVILIDFDDEPGTIPAAEFDDFCNMPGYSNNGNNGSVRDYFLDVSDGLLDYSSWVMPSYYRADSLKSYYDDCSLNDKSTVRELVKEALTALDASGHDFSVYDSNTDGYIDAINVFYAGNAACPWSFGLWPSSGGITDDLTLDGVKTDRYQITDIGSSLTIGTYIHENGHMVLGLPDIYDNDFDAFGVGRWCLMGYQYSTNPQEPCAWSKITTGWTTPTVIAADQAAIPIGPSSANGNIYRFDSGNPKEYILVENRRQTGHDADLPDSGLLFLHIDEDGNNNQEDMTPGSHYRVTVIQADGDWDLENNNNSGDSTDLYSGAGAALGVCTDPNTNWWDGSQSGYNFTNITPSSTNMLFDFTTGDDPPTAACKSYSADADTDCCIDVSVDDIDDGSSDPQGTGDIASILITAVDGNPVTPASSVEVCGDGMHTVTLTITDLCGNTDDCDANVEVENEAPVALCQFFEADADSECCIIVHKEDVDNGSYDPDGAGDIKSFGISHVDGNPITLADSVQICGNGTHTVTLTITDWCDSTSSCTTNVDVNDVTPPWIATELNRDCLWPPNHKMVDILVDIEVTDNCDPDPYWELYSITSDEDDNGLGDGNTIGDITADLYTEDTAFQLRSERSGKGDGRTYTIVYRAEDESGNVAFDTSYVIVPHDMGHGAVCAMGFNSFGTGFLADAQTFTVVIPSTPAVYATKGNRELLVKPAVMAGEIDAYRAYVGNTAGALRPVNSVVLDVNNDGLDDLVLAYDAKSAKVISTGHWLSPLDGLAEAAQPGYLGLHFMGQDGTPYLVTDIFKLGTPIEIARADETEPPKPGKVDVLDTAPAAPVTYTNGIASIYPNPFNPRTTVRFTLGDAGHVTIAVYDVKGTLVRTLVDQALPGGEHTAEWDGNDAQGSSVSTGVYFTRMVTAGFETNRKMVLVK